MRSQHLFVTGAERGEQARGPLDVCEHQGDSSPRQLSHRPPVTLSSLDYAPLTACRCVGKLTPHCRLPDSYFRRHEGE